MQKWELIAASRRVLRRAAFVFKETQSRHWIIVQDTIVSQLPEHVRTLQWNFPRFFSSFSYSNSYSKVSIFDLQSNRRSAGFESTLSSRWYIERYISESTKDCNEYFFTATSIRISSHHWYTISLSFSFSIYFRNDLLCEYSFSITLLQLKNILCVCVLNLKDVYREKFFLYCES